MQRYTAVVVLALLSVVASGQVTNRQKGQKGQKGQEEQKLIAVLRSDAPVFNKARACQRLAVIGGKDAVAALAGLLGDKALGDYARFALEPIQDAGVDDAFRAALGKLDGRPLAGVVNSIGVRRDAKAVGALQKLVAEPGKGAAAEALAALGRIATDEAVATVRGALTAPAAPLRVAAADACLVAAERLSAGGKRAEAGKLYDAVRTANVPQHLRTSATYHAILSRGPSGLPLLLAQLSGKEPGNVRVALRAARELPGAKVSEALAAALPAMRPGLQVLVIQVLADRPRGGGRKGIAALAGSGSPAVRLAALKALGRIGDDSAVAVLLRSAAAGGEESAVACKGLRMLRSDGADAGILAGMKAAKGELRVELIDVLADRRCTAATPALLAEAASADGKVASAAFKALGALASGKDLPAMVKLLGAVKGDAAGSRAETAIVLVAAKTADPARRGEAVLAALASARQRAPLIRVLGRIGGPKAYEAVEKALGDGDAGVKDAAVRALASWPDGQAEGALLKLARVADDKTHRVLALRGYVRLLGLATSRKPRATAAKYAEVLTVARDTDSRKLVLAGLADVGHADALKLAMDQLGDSAVAAEAALAAVKIARAIVSTDRKAARAAMVKLLAVSKGKPAAAQARRVLGLIDRFADSITAWRIAGPYSQKGKGYDALFDVAFGPEKPGAKGVKWRGGPAGTDAERPWILDLLKALGGEQRVGYALTWVHSAKAQPARLELGTDDGVKAWLNGRLVHAKNAPRAAVAYTDKADVTLKAGWNRLLLKITQNNGPWEFCARICGRDGRALANIRVDAGHEGDTPPPAAPTAK